MIAPLYAGTSLLCAFAGGAIAFAESGQPVLGIAFGALAAWFAQRAIEAARLRTSIAGEPGREKAAIAERQQGVSIDAAIDAGLATCDLIHMAKEKPLTREDLAIFQGAAFAAVQNAPIGEVVRLAVSATLQSMPPGSIVEEGVITLTTDQAEELPDSTEGEDLSLIRSGEGFVPAEETIEATAARPAGQAEIISLDNPIEILDYNPSIGRAGLQGGEGVAVAIPFVEAEVVTPDIGSRWRQSNGVEYEVVALANGTSELPEYPVTVVYRNIENGEIWALKLEDWYRNMTLMEGT